ncbi:SDR family oxidoreductase [Ferrimonas lipolytica]|uniref:SDR family oxidoreductase n=1 Tax=Ferrimonas lipolytica TaxID=2724191 RepID=A0A6H1UJC4_9GAMM|nr:SDR family oxidoreductase [Ferrimonas lipolytica]QIZ78729.1 SDR family oxidoreductase [Ferrimonas lipolytica]
MERKNILITGASSGLGLEMAKQFAAKGRNLALCARRVERLEAVKAQLEQNYPDIKVVIKSLDVNDHDQVFEVFRAFNAEFEGGLDRVIVNAGMGKGASLGTGYFKANKETAITNFVSAIAQCEAALEIFRAKDDGHLVNISSMSAVRGFRRALTVYAASKAALSNLTEGIRVDLLGTNIKASCIHPGFIRSEINEKVEKVPFMVDTDVGVAAMIRAIEAEKTNAFVPSWPWAYMRHLMKWAPIKYLRAMS